jgi:diguanylate cyclase (GGDEF)-like protein
VAPNQLKKKLSRALMVSWRDQPTRHDVAALQANTRRVGLVIKLRWTLLAVLVIYSMIAGVLYTGVIPSDDFLELMVVPAITLGLVVLYNAFYATQYRRLASISVWNNLQLGLDVLVVTVLVYFSGGVNSWFWSVYALIIFEAAFILPRSRDVWLHAAMSVGLLGAVEILELVKILPHNVIPFAVSDVHHNSVFVMVRYSWQVAVLLGAAWVSTMLVGEFRRELETRRANSLMDDDTGLFTRDHLMRALRTEIRRAQRDRRSLHIMLIDIDQFGEFNTRFGIDAGDRLILEFARTLSIVAGTDDPQLASTNIAARVGGEEFAILMAENAPFGTTPSCDDAAQTARGLAEALSAIRVDGAGVTVSVGVASMPEDGVTIDQLMDAADMALAQAIGAGGNRVFVATECPVEAEEPSADYDAE